MKPVKAAPWVHEVLVACVDGPYAGQWFLLGDWQVRVNAAHATAHVDSVPSPALLYRVDATPTVPHPTQPAMGRAARFRALRSVH